MFPIIGIVVLLVMVFGGFAFTGGALGPVLEAIPHEMLIIGGAAAGALIIGNSGKELKGLGGGLMKVFKGPKYKKQDYLDVIFLISKLMKMLRVDGPIALEPPSERSTSGCLRCRRSSRPRTRTWSPGRVRRRAGSNACSPR